MKMDLALSAGGLLLAACFAVLGLPWFAMLFAFFAGVAFDRASNRYFRRHWQQNEQAAREHLRRAQESVRKLQGLGQRQQMAHNQLMDELGKKWRY